MGFARALYPPLDRTNSWQAVLLWLNHRAECVKMQKAYSMGPSFIEGQYILAQQFRNPNESICSITERGWQSQRGEQALWQLPSQQPYEHLLGGSVSDQDRASLGRETWNEAEVPRFQVTVPSKPLCLGS